MGAPRDGDADKEPIRVSDVLISIGLWTVYLPFFAVMWLWEKAVGKHPPVRY